MTSQSTALPLRYLNELARESTAQIETIKDLFLSSFERPPLNQSALAAFFIEALWSNYRILHLASLHVKEAPEGEEEVHLATESLQVLQSLLLNREMAIIELNLLSYSISVH